MFWNWTNKQQINMKVYLSKRHPGQMKPHPMQVSRSYMFPWSSQVLEPLTVWLNQSLVFPFRPSVLYSILLSLTDNIPGFLSLGQGLTSNPERAVNMFAVKNHNLWLRGLYTFCEPTAVPIKGHGLKIPTKPHHLVETKARFLIQALPSGKTKKEYW